MEIERAAVFAGQGKLKEARDTLKGVIDSGGSDVPRARVMLATVLLRLNDRPALEECLEGLRETRAGQAMAAAIEGQISWRERDWEHARRAFERAANLNPGSREAFEWLLRLDMLQGQTDSGNRHAAKLLQLDPGHALGNYVLGSLQISEGEYELAEDSLRKSLERRKTPGALNDLAWLLQRRESYAEAEKRVREALAMDENAYQSWDTLGVILTKTGRADDAAKAFEKALGIFRESPSVFLHMAELESRRGNAKRAGEFADMAATKREQLSPDDQEKLDAILRTVAK
jgi:tetratricopeptide (TPR) repeat protein